MSYKKTSVAIIVLCLILLLQTSFLVHFGLFGYVPNLIVVFLIFWNIFDRDKNLISSGLIASIFGGLLLDLFSSRIIGFNVAIMIAMSFFIKVIFKNYVRVPFIERF
jgi:rod shape-determining protein MreD